MSAYLDWIEATWTMIQTMLTMAGIPFSTSTRKNNDIHHFPLMKIKHIVFSWKPKADVAIGCLHYYDAEMESNTKQVILHPYPTIETIGFSWDGNDVTTFRTPEEFLKKIAGEYEEYLQDVKKQKTTKNDTWQAVPSFVPKESGRYSWEGEKL